ncbi:MAG: carboxypeptidase-like regulatory domain-containing protein, partial [Prolixibacteraceae bacterium]|nr:carboxypeptidase-like regulatory domain-containing protein [Prolixibacteraceae bacterium]
MRKFALLIACMVLCSLHVVFAQSRSITGTVTDADDGSSLPGVSVVVKGTSLGTVTDIDGKFTLNITEDAAKLMFSFVGMRTIEVDITSASNYNVKLEKSD